MSWRRLDSTTHRRVLSSGRRGTVRVNWRNLNSFLVLDGGGLGNISTILTTLEGRWYSGKLDLASGFRQVPIAEADRYKIAFGDNEDCLFKSTRAGLCLAALPAAYTRNPKRSLGKPNLDVVSWLDDILISSYTLQDYLATIADAITTLSEARLSTNFAKATPPFEDRKYPG